MLTGLGMFIWRVQNCEGGKIDAIVKMAVDAHLSHVLIKIADRHYPYNAAYVQDLTGSMRAAGLQVWGWQYIYGEAPSAEALAVIPIIQELDLDGFVVNAEVEYKTPGSAARAKLYMQTLRAGVGLDLPIALSSYRWPSYHREFPFAAFLELCDFAMPQVYWMQAHNPTYQLQRTLTEYAGLAVRRPVFPTGACFRQSGWQPTAVEVAAFIQACKDHGLMGCNFWEWGNARSYVQDGWEVIRSTGWANTPAPEPDPVPGEHSMRVLVDGLRVRKNPSLSAPVEDYLSQGQLVRIVNIVSTELWAQLSDGNYAAVLVDGKRYMEDA